MGDSNANTRCDVCKELIRRKNEIPLQEDNYITLHVDADVINKSKQHKDRKQKEQRDVVVLKLKTYLSALRNSKGGVLLVHVIGLDKADRNLDYFHELVDVRLNDMIEDGSLFVITYKKKWLPFVNDDFTSFIAIIVTPSAYVVTLDFKTKNPLDNAIVDPSSFTILKLLQEAETQTESEIEAVVLGLGLDNFQESRCIQVKVLTISPDADNGLSSFVEYIWDKLKLKFYITSFSKLEEGGSFFLGIEEQTVDYPSYTSKSLQKTGFTLHKSHHTQFEAALKKKAKEEIVILAKQPEGIRFFQTDNIIKVKFHPVEGKDLYVLEVAVAAVEGLVFYDKEGPEAYELDTKSGIRRLNKREWYSRFMAL